MSIRCIDVFMGLVNYRRMSRSLKSEQLQIRISAAQKSAIEQAARRAGMDMSSYVLQRVLPPVAERFQECVTSLAGPAAPSFALAELNRLLSALTTSELREAVAEPPAHLPSALIANYVAAMVEYACGRGSISPPAWIAAVPPLTDPLFGSELPSLRLYLLTRSPPPFRRRNIFIDSSLGGQV